MDDSGSRSPHLVRMCNGWNVPSVAFSHSGHMAGTWSPPVCFVRNTRLGTINSTWHTESVVQCVAFSLDDKQMICILKGSGTSEQWDIESGTMLDSSHIDRSTMASEPGVSEGFCTKHHVN
jgi:hypothetical protein